MLFSVLAATDGSIWIATHDGLTRWKKGQMTIFRKANGLPDDAMQSLFQDDAGRIWVFTAHGLAYFKDGRFVAVDGVPGEKCIPSPATRRATSGFQRNKSLLHLREGRLIEQIPWSELGRHQQASVLSPTVTKADSGLDSGTEGAWRISRMVRSARRIQPLMGWARALSPVFNSIGMGRCGPQRRRRPEPDQRRPHHHAHKQEWLALRHDSLDDRGRRSFVLAVYGLRPGAHHADRTGRVDRRPGAQGSNDGLGCGGWRQAPLGCGYRLTVLASRSPPTANCGS